MLDQDVDHDFGYGAIIDGLAHEGIERRRDRIQALRGDRTAVPDAITDMGAEVAAEGRGRGRVAGGAEFFGQMVEGHAPGAALAVEFGQGLGRQATDAAAGKSASMLNSLSLHGDPSRAGARPGR